MSPLTKSGGIPTSGRFDGSELQELVEKDWPQLTTLFILFNRQMIIINVSGEHFEVRLLAYNRDKEILIEWVEEDAREWVGLADLEGIAFGECDG